MTARHRWLVGALSLVVLVVTGCSSAAGGGDGLDTVEITSSAGQAELLIKPAGSVAGLVVFMHGADADRTQILGKAFRPLRTRLLAEHLAIVASDAHGDNMGNAAGVQDQVLAVRDARAHLGNIARVDILAFSMGGLDALLTAASHRVVGLQSVALLSPAVDQRTFLQGHLGNLIDKAFGYPKAAQVAALLRTSDPALQPVARYRGYRYHFWHSPSDHTVPVAQSIVMSRTLAGAGVDTGVTALTGDHGDLSALRPQDVVDLFAQTH